MSAYHENQGIREAIDRILKRNARRQANQGLETTDEQKERDAREWSNDLMQIAKLDKDFADTLHVEE
jgi:uncharacterized protein (DUF2164 family)